MARIIGTYMNEERTQAFHISDNGTLVHIKRSSASDVWSPPKVVAKLVSSTEAFRDAVEGVKK